MVGKTQEGFMELFGVPDFVESYIHIFFSQEEIDLVLKMGKEEYTVEQISDLLGESDSSVLVESCYQRFVLDKKIEDGKTLYYIGSFPLRLNNQAMYGNYNVLPRDLRRKLDEWYFEVYQKDHDYFRVVKENEPDYENCHNDIVFLLEEAEEHIDHMDWEIALVPCDCRMLSDSCDYPRETCLHMSETISDRMGGRRITKEEAKQIIRMADEKGLMHTGGPAKWREKGSFSLCNCCACCCYPFRAGAKLGTKGKWPKSNYIVHFNDSMCSSCGRCVERCHFAAWSFDEDGDTIKFNPALCWGCGLCANTCPTGAIKMEALKKSK
ncbi:MAG: 4Fe-4S binding protein [Dehalobacterium sp.]